MEIVFCKPLNSARRLLYFALRACTSEEDEEVVTALGAGAGLTTGAATTVGLGAGVVVTAEGFGATGVVTVVGVGALGAVAVEVVGAGCDAVPKPKRRKKPLVIRLPILSTELLTCATNDDVRDGATTGIPLASYVSALTSTGATKTLTRTPIIKNDDKYFMREIIQRTQDRCTSESVDNFQKHEKVTLPYLLFGSLHILEFVDDLLVGEIEYIAHKFVINA